MNIRKATPADAPEIARLMNLAMQEITFQFIGKNDPEAANDFLAHFIALPNNQYSYENIFIAEEDGQILGQISLYDGASLETLRKPIWDKIKSDYHMDYFAENETQAGEIYIDTLAVDPKTQGRGIGKLLIQYAIENLVNKEGKILGLLVDNDNPQAKKLYEKLGFRVINEVKIFGKTMEHMQYT